MSDLPVPAVLAILVVVLLVLVALVMLIVRGRWTGQAADGATAAEVRAPSPQVPASPENVDPDPVAPVAGTATEGAEDTTAADEDPRPWRERHGRRASRPLLGQHPSSDAASWEVSPERSTEHRS